MSSEHLLVRSDVPHLDVPNVGKNKRGFRFALAEYVGEPSTLVVESSGESSWDPQDSGGDVVRAHWVRLDRLLVYEPNGWMHSNQVDVLRSFARSASMCPDGALVRRW